MPTDYRKLCVDLFGTDDVAKLEQIAAELKTKNTRNAGRKKKFTPADVGAMEKLLAQGCTVQQVAERFGTSRQIVAKYVNPKPKKGCTLRMTYMCGHRPLHPDRRGLPPEEGLCAKPHRRPSSPGVRGGGGPHLGGLPGVFEKPLLPGHPGKRQGGTAGAGPHRLRSAPDRGKDPRTHSGR